MTANVERDDPVACARNAGSASSSRGCRRKTRGRTRIGGPLVAGSPSVKNSRTSPTSANAIDASSASRSVTPPSAVNQAGSTERPLHLPWRGVLDVQSLSQTSPATSSALPRMRGLFERSDGPVHRYMTSSPGCWRAFGSCWPPTTASPERMAVPSDRRRRVRRSASRRPDGPATRAAADPVGGVAPDDVVPFPRARRRPELGTKLHRKMIGRPVFTGSIARRRRADGAARSRRRVRQTRPVSRHTNGRRRVGQLPREHGTVRRWLREAGFEL